jgi:hypothetical protein
MSTPEQDSEPSEQEKHAGWRHSMKWLKSVCDHIEVATGESLSLEQADAAATFFDGERSLDRKRIEELTAENKRLKEDVDALHNGLLANVKKHLKS